MPTFACAVFALALQDPQQDLNPASLVAPAPPAPAAAQEAGYTQDAPPQPVAEPSGLDSLEQELDDFEREFQAGWNVDVSGYLKFGFLGSNARRTVNNNSQIRNFSMTAARLWVDAEIEGWQLRFGFRAEEYSGLGYFGLSGQPGDLRLFQMEATRVFNEHARLQIGRIRSPFLQSGLYDDNQLLFFDRSFLGEEWDNFTPGAALNIRIGNLEGWIGVQNGVDGAGQDVGLTGRGLWHITGGRGGMHITEGPYDAPEELAVSVGGAVYYDTSTRDVSAQALEAYVSARPLYFATEVVDEGEGLGDLYSWVVTAATMLGKSLSLQGRIESFDRNDDTDLYRVGLTYYLIGQDTKLHLEYAEADSNAPLANIQSITFGAQFSF